MANTTIQLKFSTVASNTPSSLANGEIAINGADGKLFYRTPSGTIQSIVSGTGPAGLNKEIQFNDSGVAGSNSALTFDKASASLNVTNINVTTRITTGGGAGGTIAGANAIFANSFIANTGGITTTGNSTLNGIVTVNYINAAGVPNAAIEMYGANTKGGVGYFDFIAANNRSAGTTNPNKFFRIESNGKFQIINSAYTVNIFDLNDSGYLTIPGALATSQYIQFSDGSRQYTANAGGALSNTQILAGLQTVSPTANITFDTMILANNNNGRNLRIGDDAWIGDINLQDTIAIRGAFSAANAYIVFGNADTTALGRAGSGALTYGGNTVWHAGNDGTGSGLDADLLDGLNSSSFANTAYTQSAFDKANTAGNDAAGAGTYANAAFAKANSANVLAQNAYNAANTDYTTISATAGVYGNAAFVPVTILTANGRVSSITNTAIAIDTAAITSGTLADARLPTKGTAGTYGNTTYLPVITTDAYGRVTAVTNTAISFPTATDTLQTVTTRGSTTANAISITNATSSTSKTTGALTVAGGVGVAGNVSTLGINVDNRIDWPASGTGAPTFTTRSAGTKLLVYPAISGSQADYAMGIDSATLWSSVPVNSSSFYFKWYGGTTNITSLDGTGEFTTSTINVYSTTASTSNTTGVLKVSGGVGVRGNVYADAVYDGGVEVIVFANSAFNKANAAFTQANSAYSLAQTAIDTATAMAIALG